MREEPRGQDECGCCFYSTYLLNGKFFVSQKNANFAIVEPDGRKLTIRPSENMIRTILNNFLLMENYGYSRMNGRKGRFENRFAPKSSGGSQWNGRYGTFSGSEQFRTAGGRDTNGYDVIGYSTYPEDLRKKRRRKIIFWGVLISVALSYGYYKITGWTSKSSEQQDSAALELLETDEPSKSDGMATLGDDEDYLSESESDDEDLYDDDDYLSENGLDDEDEDANAVSSDRRTEGNASRSENSTVSTLSGVDIDEVIREAEKASREAVEAAGVASREALEAVKGARSETAKTVEKAKRETEKAIGKVMKPSGATNPVTPPAPIVPPAPIIPPAPVKAPKPSRSLGVGRNYHSVSTDELDREIHADAVKEARRKGLSTSGSTSDIYDRIIHDDAVKEARRKGVSTSGSTSDIYDRIIHDDAVKEARRMGVSTSGSTSDIYDRIIQKEMKNMKW